MFYGQCRPKLLPRHSKDERGKAGYPRFGSRDAQPITTDSYAIIKLRCLIIPGGTIRMPWFGIQGTCSLRYRPLNSSRSLPFLDARETSEISLSKHMISKLSSQSRGLS
jgi:hypothetical protein